MANKKIPKKKISNLIKQMTVRTTITPRMSIWVRVIIRMATDDTERRATMDHFN